MKTLFLTVITLCLLIGGVETALAESPSMEEIMTSRGYGPDTVTKLEQNDYIFGMSDKTISVVYIKDVGEVAADNNEVGYYLTSNPNDPIALVDTVDEEKTFNPSGSFGLYMEDKTSGVENIWYTQKSRNTDGNNHVRVYQIKGTNSYFIGFEDRKGTSADWDYNDIVVKIDNVNVNVPEFPTVALPVAAVLGLIFVFGRKKGDL